METEIISGLIDVITMLCKLVDRLYILLYMQLSTEQAAEIEDSIKQVTDKVNSIGQFDIWERL